MYRRTEECKEGQNRQGDRQSKMNIHGDGQTYRHYANLMFGMSGQGFCLVIKVDGLHGKLDTAVDVGQGEGTDET